MTPNFEIISSWKDIKIKIIDEHLNIIIKQSKRINKESSLIYKEINNRIEDQLYKNLDKESCINTIKYIFYKIRSGIFIKIENNKLVAFIPFANKNFINNWYKNVTLYKGKNLKEYIYNKRKIFRYNKNYISYIKNWWANAYIINNEVVEDIWGQHSLIEYYNIIQETLKNHQINNCIFIINKRDHPILNKNLYEPYLNFYPKINNKPPKIEKIYQFNNFIPILSPYTNKDYLDIPFIIPQDWQLAIQDKSYYEIKEEVKWEDKIPVALFRGSATGSMELKYNQRLQISNLDKKLNNKNLLDAGIVSWNSRDKIDSNLQINYIKPYLFDFKLKEKIPMNEQIKYKYIINIDGHSNPNRTSYLLQINSLIMIVESKYVVGNICWYTNILKPYEHYIPIKYDLSDLEEKILWCRNNDEKCKQIVQNANKLYNKYFSKENILLYCKYLFNQISNNFNK
jgi:hypothetical protein